MATTLLLLEPDEAADLNLFLKLAERLGVKATLGPPATPAFAESLTAARNQYLNELLHEVAGSWQSDESGEELVKQIYEARTHNAHRDAEIEALLSGPVAKDTPLGE